jgi:hypothetical protein
VLCRSDQHVAWRGQVAPTGAALDTLLRRLRGAA